MKKGLKIFLIIFLIVIFLAIILYFVFDFKSVDDIKKIFNSESSVKVNDNENGLYSYSYDLATVKNIYPGCSVKSINYYILVINDDYYGYKSTCMATYLKDSGKTSDLDINYNKDTNEYTILYSDVVFKKDNSLFKIEEHTKIKNSLEKISLNSLKFILEQTEFEGEYYKINADISDLNFLANVNVEYKNWGFDFTLGSGNYEYKAFIRDLDYFPEFYPYYNSLIIIDNKGFGGNNNKNVIVVNEKGKIFDLKNYFPMIINGVEISLDSFKVDIVYDRYNKYYRLFISKYDKFCVENSTSSNISYYEFKISYDYTKNNLQKPEFVSVGLEKDGCDYIRGMLG